MSRLRVDDVSSDFENLKISALSKSKEINSFIKNTTLGPNSTIIEEEEITVANNTDYESPKSPKNRTPISPNTTTIISKLLDEMENQRQGKVREAVKYRLNCILDFAKKQNSNYRQHLQRQQQALVNGKQQQELVILQALEQHDKDTLMHQEQQQQYYRELAEKRKQHNKEIEAHEQRRQKISAIIDSIKRDQVEFRNVYQEIINLFKNCKFQGQLKDVLGDIPKQLKALPDGMEEIVNRCKAGKISEDESRRSNELVKEIQGILAVVQEKISIVGAALEQQQQSVRNIPKPEPVIAETQPEKPIVTTNNTAAAQITPNTKPVDVKLAKIDEFISRSSLRIYSELQEYLENYTKAYDELVQNTTFKEFRFDCKKAVNIPVNAISAVSTHHLLDKYNRLTDLLFGKTVEVGNTKVCAARHPQGIAFCTNLLAKKFVLQGDLMISSNPDAAFCYAAIISAIWHDNPDFGKLLLGHFHKQCPYLVPLNPPRGIGQSDEEFYISQGYQYTDGVIEKQDKFLKRMTGIMRLYAAILISKPKKGQHKNPHGLSEGWRWLAAFLNLQPKPDITATMLHVFLEIAGATLQVAYGKMFQKIMIYICHVYLPMIQKIDSGGPVTRLEVLLQKFRKSGRFELPHGILPNNFW